MKTFAPRPQIETDGHTELDLSSALPQRPRFLHELLVAQVEDGIVVDGADQLHVFWGDSTRNVLPNLIPLMDGSRTLRELEVALPELPTGQVQAAVSSLFDWGLVEDGTDGASMDVEPNAETLAFLRRYFGVTGINRNGHEAYERLLEKSVLLVTVGEVGELGQQLKLLLERTGVRQVAIWEAATFESWIRLAGVSRQQVVVSLSLGRTDHERVVRLDDLCADLQISWLRVVLDEAEGFADIGPMFNRKETPCYRCFSATHSRRAQVSPDANRMASCDLQFWVGMVATELVYLISKTASFTAAGDFRRYDLADWRSQPLRFPRIPGCPTCRSLPQVPQAHIPLHGSLVDTAVVFEDYVGSWYQPETASKASQTQSTAIPELTRQTKRLSNCHQQLLTRDLPALASPIQGASTGALAPQSLSLSQLGAMLLMTAGIRVSGNQNVGVKRWAATGGNLGSVELFVAVRECDGLAPGYYFYQPREHSLARLDRRSPMLPVEEFMTRAVACDSTSLPSAMVLFTAAFHRVRQKYGPFGYRLINLDAGVALSQLHLVAQCLGIPSQTAVRWADDLIENQLHLEPVAEQSTAVVLLNGKNSGPWQPPLSGIEPRNGTPSSTKSSHCFCDIPVQGIGTMTYRESRMLEGNLRDAAYLVADNLHVPEHFGFELTPLPRPSTASGLVGDILRSRNSIRRYSDQAVPLEPLSTMLSFAHQADTREWREEHYKGQPLQYFLLASRVAGLDPGVFVYKPSDHSLLRLRAPLDRESASHLYVQPEFADAPAAIWIVGNLAATCARHGAFGHRELLLRAGAAGNRLWMVALGAGLSGTLIAGVGAGAARRELGLDGYRETALLAFTVGHSQEGDSVPGLVQIGNRREPTSGPHRLRRSM